MRQNIVLYRSILRAAHKFQDYNFRSYFLRRAREDWRRNVDYNPTFIAGQREHLAVLQRQAIVSSLFPSPTYSDPQNKSANL
ncbi:unnamed protein product [Amoebophrya sp. A120]|nr:unnamed protein product [Amoebophrya sp. A120]|eukprot:GSA120T00004764001.1